MERPENLSTKLLKDLFDSGEITTEQLNEYVRRLRSALKMADETLNHQIVAIKAASIAGQTEGAETGMKWLNNYLFGPGLLPTDEELAMGAQPFADANMIG